jgi:hypothetical protein
MRLTILAVIVVLSLVVDQFKYGGYYRTIVVDRIMTLAPRQVR